MTVLEEFRKFEPTVNENVTMNSCNETEYVNFLNSYVYWTVIDMLVMFVILTGNVMTITALTTCKTLQKRKSNKCILNLAVSDLTVGLTLPYHIAFYLNANLRNNNVTCIMKFSLIILACSASIVNTIIVAVDKYIAILHPLHYKKYMSETCFTTLVVVGWTCSFGISMVPVFWNYRDTPDICCDMHVVIPRAFVIFVMIPFFSLMWMIMMVAYVKIWREVVLHANRMRGATCNPLTKKNWKRLQVLLMILGSFTICWLPYVIVVFIQIFTLQHSNFILYMTVLYLAKVNSGLNPIIYAWKNREFTKAFYCLIRCQNPNNYDRSEKSKQTSTSLTIKMNRVKTVSNEVLEKDIK